MRNWESVEIAKAMNVAEGGMAPELIQGRLAMLGWLGVIFAEKFTGQPTVEQVRRSTHPALPLRTTLPRTCVCGWVGVWLTVSLGHCSPSHSPRSSLPLLSVEHLRTADEGRPALCVYARASYPLSARSRRC